MEFLLLYLLFNINIINELVSLLVAILDIFKLIIQFLY